jgi:hypothetical protein
MQHHRSYRGTLASRTREALFSVFGETRLDPINTSSTASEISAWKRSKKTAKCYARLFQRISNNEESSYMSRILERIWPKSDCTEEQVAFAITICECFLDPEYDSIQINEYGAKNLLIDNKVCVRIYSKVYDIIILINII